MLRLIKMYLYRASRLVSSKLWFVLLEIILLVPMAKMVLFSSNREADIAVFDIILQIISSGMPCMICSFFISGLFAHDEKGGYIKNIITSINDRKSLFFSRIAVTAVYLFLIYFIIIVSTLVIYGLVLKMEIISDINIIMKLVMSYWLSVSFLCFVNMVIIIAKSVTLPVMMTLISISGLIALPVLMINLLIIKLFKSDSFDLGEHLVSTCLKGLNYDFDLCHHLLIGAVYILVSFFCSLLVLRKRDV